MTEHYVTAVALDVGRTMLCCRCGYTAYTAATMAATVWDQHRLLMEDLARQTPDAPVTPRTTG